MPDQAIAWYQILAAGVLTGAAVWLAARRSNWPVRSMFATAVGVALLIGLWRWLANLWQLNADFLPLVSVGDALCLLAGALPPAVAALFLPVHTQARWLPIGIGALAGFIINVVIL